VEDNVVDKNVASGRNVRILDERGTHILACTNFTGIHSANAAVYDDIAALDLRTANHPFDFNISGRLD